MEDDEFMEVSLDDTESLLLLIKVLSVCRNAAAHHSPTHLLDVACTDWTSQVIVEIPV